MLASVTMSDRPGRGAKHLDLLDGMRGVAAVIVVLHHLGGLLVLPWLAPRGYLAVDFFFLLSGFVVSHAYWDRILNRMSARRFGLIRAVRLYPMIVFGAVLGAVIAPYTFRHAAVRHDDAFVALVLGCLGIPIIKSSSLPAELFPFDGPLWSIFFELLANALFFVLASSKSRVRWSVVIMLFGGLSLLMLDELSVGSRLVNWPWGFARVGFSFFAGVTLQRYGRGIRTVRPCAAMAAACAAFLMPRFGSHDIEFDLLVVLIVFPVAISALATVATGDRLSRLCRLSGEISYPLYAIHYPFALAIGSSITLTRLPWEQRFVLSVVSTLLLGGLAWFVSRLYERPMRAAVSRRLSPALVR